MKKNVQKTALITGITGQDGSYLAEFFCLTRVMKYMVLNDVPRLLLRNV